MNIRGMILVSCLFAAGCASAPEIQHPELDIEIPSRWTAAETTGGDVPDQWWEAFNDPALNDAVRLAIEHNYDLRAAAARIARAEAEARIAGADLKPTLDLNLGAARRRQNFIGLPIPGSDGGVQSSLSSSFSPSLQLSWELDLWGRVRSGKSAALFHTKV